MRCRNTRLRPYGNRLAGSYKSESSTERPAVGLDSFERREFFDRMQRARQAAYFRAYGVFRDATAVLEGFVVLCSLIALFATGHWVNPAWCSFWARLRFSTPKFGGAAKSTRSFTSRRLNSDAPSTWSS